MILLQVYNRFYDKMRHQEGFHVPDATAMCGLPAVSKYLLEVLRGLVQELESRDFNTRRLKDIKDDKSEVSMPLLAEMLRLLSRREHGLCLQ